MDEFSYLSVLLSIILGLAITQILKSFRGLLLARNHIHSYWLPIGWAVLLLVIDVQTWWAMFGLRTHHTWTFLGFSVVLLHIIILYMLAALVLPDFFGEKTIDLGHHYYGHRRIFFGLAGLAAVVSLCKDLVLDGRLPDDMNVAFHGVFIALSATAALTRREWCHQLLLPLTAMLFVAYIIVLFGQLQ